MSKGWLNINSSYLNLFTTYIPGHLFLDFLKFKKIHKDDLFVGSFSFQFQ